MKIEKIFEQQAISGQHYPFVFSPQPKDHKVVGLLFSSGIDVSLSFYDATDLIYHDQRLFHTPNVAPDKRVIRFEKLLYDKAVQGKISVPSKNDGTVEIIRTSVHLMIEEL